MAALPWTGWIEPAANKEVFEEGMWRVKLHQFFEYPHKMLVLRFESSSEGNSILVVTDTELVDMKTYFTAQSIRLSWNLEKELTVLLNDRIVAVGRNVRAFTAEGFRIWSGTPGG